MSVCPSFRMEQLVTRWTDFHENYDMNILRKYVEKIPISLKCDKAKGTLVDVICEFMVISRLILRRVRNISDKIEEKNIHFICSNFFPKIMLFMR